MSNMADAVASGVLGMVFDKLGTMVMDELRLLKDVGEELKKLESTLSTLRLLKELKKLGGLGKTTLAQLVFRDPQVSEHFLTRIWVYVSEKFEIMNVGRSIIKSLKETEPEPSSMDSMENKVLKQIKGKKFLLVLDDVWTEDYEPWEKLESLLKNGAKGSKVIVTTRSTRVASVMKSDKSYSLGGLPDDDCWKLFQNNAFGSDGDCAKDPNLLAIGKEIVQKCGGLPLAAKALGSVLRFKTRESEWREVRDNEIWKQFQDDNQILPALMLSYKHLSQKSRCWYSCGLQKVLFAHLLDLSMLIN